MFRRFRPSDLVGLLVAVLATMADPASASPALRQAPNLSAAPVDQLSIAGNACGPAALLAAFRFGNTHWQRAAEAVPGTDDKSRLRSIIQTRGTVASAHIPGRIRWSRSGVNVADLCDIANEMCLGQALPRLDQEVFFLKPGETPELLLKRVHRRLATSLEKGFPPVISIRRFVHRKSAAGTAEWVAVDGHFVTLLALPRRLDRHARSFPVTYLDPWGGKRVEGWIGVPDLPLLAAPGSASACLEAVFPQALVGKNLLRPGERSALSLSAAICRH